MMIVSVGLGAMFVGRHHRRERRGQRRQGRAGRRAAQFLTAGRRRARPRDLLCDRHRRTNHLLRSPSPAARLTSGFQRALLAECIFMLAAAVIALRTTNTRGETDHAVPEEDARWSRR